ncbi:MAG: hypothetical protein WD271_04685 [Acidimicrobiia bacterium]
MITGLRRFWGRPIGVACASGVIALLVVAGIALASEHGVSGFVHAAPPWTDPAAAPSSLEVLPRGSTFDGQFYYRMAVRPFSTAERVEGVIFDTPALRSARIGYPLLGYLGSLGDPDLVPLALIAVNVLAMFALGWFGGALAVDSGRPAVWGLLLPLYPGFVYSLGFDLTEIVAAASLAGAVLALRRQHTVVAVLLATYAVLTRETAAVLPIALVVMWVWEFARRRIGAGEQRAQLIVGVIPLAVAAVWQIALRLQWGSFPIGDSGNTNIVVPLSGLIDARDKFSPSSGAGLFRDASLAFLVLAITVAAVSLARSHARPYEKAAFVFAVVVAMLPNHFIWAGATSFMRAATEAYVFAVIVVMGARIAADKLLAASTVAMFGLTVGSEISKAK